IRDRNVTGVQTCALPILLVTVAAVAAWAVVCKVRGHSAAPALWGGLKAVGVQLTALAVAAVFAYFVWLAGAGYRVDALVPLTEKIGRASCRGRGWWAGRG